MNLHQFAELAEVVALLDSHNAEQQLRSLESLRRSGVVWSDLCWQLLDVLTQPEDQKPQPVKAEPAKPKVKAKSVKRKPIKPQPQKIAPLAERLAARTTKAPQRRTLHHG